MPHNRPPNQIQRPNQGGARGFTLVEAVITITIVALAAAVVVPTLGGSGIVELKKSSRMLAGLLRTTYEDAALTGQMHRVTLVIGQNEVKVERTGQILAFEPGSNALAQAAKPDAISGLEPGALYDFGSLSLPGAEGDPEGGGGGGGDDLISPGVMDALVGMGDLGGSGGVAGGFEAVGKPFKLDDGIRLMDVRLGTDARPQTEGEVGIVFFPHGYTQDAVVHLETESGQVYAVTLAALTGKTTIVDHYLAADGGAKRR